MLLDKLFSGAKVAKETRKQINSAKRADVTAVGNEFLTAGERFALMPFVVAKGITEGEELREHAADIIEQFDRCLFFYSIKLVSASIICYEEADEEEGTIPLSFKADLRNTSFDNAQIRDDYARIVQTALEKLATWGIGRQEMYMATMIFDCIDAVNPIFIGKMLKLYNYSLMKSGNVYYLTRKSGGKQLVVRSYDASNHEFEDICMCCKMKGGAK